MGHTHCRRKEFMIPDLQSSLLCDDVRQERNGKFILIGLFDVVATRTFPTAPQRVCIVNRWCCGQGTFQQQTRILNPNGMDVLREGRMVKVELPNEHSVATTVEFFLNMQFAVEGFHWVEITLEGDLKLRYPLHVRKVDPPAQEDASRGQA